MTISAKIVKDSITMEGIRLISIECVYPRFCHSELMTHRVFSRNAASSRAIPVQKMIDAIKNDTAMPTHWGKNQPGMQANEEHNEVCRLFPWYQFENHGPFTREQMWHKARDEAIRMASAFMNAGYHKQIVNRILEPFAHMRVLITATQWSNFMALRNHEDAQPEIRLLAIAIKEAMESSIPQELSFGQWHLPYIDDDLWFDVADDYVYKKEIDDACKKISVARCARTSYKLQDGRTSTVESDLNLFERLAGATPIHASPLEHQATPDRKVWKWFHNGKIITKDWEHPELSGNFGPGWIQYRKTIPNECQ